MSDVFFTDFRCKMEDSMLKKMTDLIKKAGIDKIDFVDKFVAVKLTFGEWGNLAFTRHQYAKVLCDYIKSKGGMPFLTDSNTLYAGYRNQALRHLDAAYMNGFSPLSTGVHVIIADGLRGTDEREVPVRNGVLCKTAKIGSAIVEADVIISLTHFKGHMFTGYGGVLKNVGMGAGSKMGKMEMHSSGKITVDADKCIKCGTCTKHCNFKGIVIENKQIVVKDTCVGCGHCIAYCPKECITSEWSGAPEEINIKMAEYTQAVLQDKPHFHVCFVQDVSPLCDCNPGNDVPVVPDIGVFAGFDPVAVDQACIDAVNNAEIYHDSHLGKHAKDPAPHDIGSMICPNSGWETGLEHAEKIGLGTRKYNLIKV